jgi:hypothetical protein
MGWNGGPACTEILARHLSELVAGIDRNAQR